MDGHLGGRSSRLRAGAPADAVDPPPTVEEGNARRPAPPTRRPLHGAAERTPFPAQWHEAHLPRAKPISRVRRHSTKGEDAPPRAKKLRPRAEPVALGRRRSPACE